MALFQLHALLCSATIGRTSRVQAHGMRVLARGPHRHPSLAAALSGDGHLNLESPTDLDLESLEKRQLGHKVSGVIGCGLRCKHGFPQAFAYDPVTRAPWVVNGVVLPRKTKLESGLFRLSCPLLVKAIDEWEAEGAVQALNDEVRATIDEFETDGAEASLAAKLHTAHMDHAAARKELIGDRLGSVLEEAAAAGEEQQHIADMVLDSGIAGQTRSKVDIKCVHAQLADHLCRSESNGLAAELMSRLEARGVPVRGGDACHAQCNPAVPENAAREQWWYEPNKNKWKLRKRQNRRKAKKAVERGSAGLLVDEELVVRELDRASG